MQMDSYYTTNPRPNRCIWLPRLPSLEADLLRVKYLHPTTQLGW